VLAGSAVVAVATAAVVAGLAATLPDPTALREENPTHSRYMRLQAHERGVADDAYTVDWVPLSAITPLLACAVVKGEDGRFFRHGGIDWAQLEKAAGRALSGAPRIGGSTITQQLARNLFLDPSPTPLRKARELLLAPRLERMLSKRRILELYLNVVEWGDGIWGAKPASAQYFGKAPGDLDAFEATFLAALLPAPRRDLRGANLLRAWNIQFRVLHQLYVSGLLDAAEWRAVTARAEAVRRRLATGRSLRAALAEPVGHAVPLPVPPRLDNTPLPLAHALDEECGLERERAEIARLRAWEVSVKRGHAAR